MKKGKLIGNSSALAFVFVMDEELLAGFGSEKHQALAGTGIIIAVPCIK